MNTNRIDEKLAEMRAIIEDMNCRMTQLEHEVAARLHSIEIENQKARNWNGPNLDTKESS